MNSTILPLSYHTYEIFIGQTTAGLICVKGLGLKANAFYQTAHSDTGSRMMYSRQVNYYNLIY